MNDVLQRPGPSDKTLPVLNRLKAKIVQLHNRRLQKILDDNKDAERPRRRPADDIPHLSDGTVACRADHILRDGTGQMHTTPSAIAQPLTAFLRNMYGTLEVNDVSMEKLVEVVRCEQHTSYEGMLEWPLERTELHRVVQTGERKKAPGNDGLGREFDSHIWATIKDDLCEVINQIFWAGNISQQQKRGVIVCLSKAQGKQTQEDYRPITLLNSDYKILALIIAQLLR
jgi:hypothetical protein